MPLINTTTDLIQLLEENEEFRQAVRHHVLTDELIQLPERFAKFAADQLRFNQQVNQRFDGMDQRLDGMDQRFDKMDQRFDRMDQRFDRMDQRFDKMDQRFDRMDQRFDKMDQRFDRMDQRFDRMDRNIGSIKAGHALISTERNAALIADLLDLEWQRTVKQHELLPIIRTLQFSRSERTSFLQADLIMVAVDGDGIDRYLAVEVSFTADRRDTDRAIRNADFLQRGTALQAIPVIASVYNDRDAQRMVDGGQVRWFKITDQMMEVH